MQGLNVSSKIMLVWHCYMRRHYRENANILDNVYTANNVFCERI